MENVRTHYRDGWWVYGDGTPDFATGGDSGAIVVDEDKRIVGMVVAVESLDPGAPTFIHGIRQIFRALQIQLP